MSFDPPQMSFQIKKGGVVATLFYLRCRELLAFSAALSDSIFASIFCNSAVVAPRAIASSRAEATRINSSPSRIFSRSDSISAGVNISPEDIALNLMGSYWDVLRWVKCKLGLHKQLALPCVHPLAPGTQQNNTASRTKSLAARVFPVWKDWILVHAIQHKESVGQALSHRQENPCSALAAEYLGLQLGTPAGTRRRRWRGPKEQRFNRPRRMPSSRASSWQFRFATAVTGHPAVVQACSGL